MILYKYAGRSGIRILETLRLKITPPNEFNDPFEITPFSKRFRSLADLHKDLMSQPEKSRNLYESMKSDGAFKGSYSNFMKGLPQALTHYYPEYKKRSAKEMAKRDLKTLDDISPNLGVLCLSEPPNSVPMWSYYGQHHQGIAFGLDIERIGGMLPGPHGFVKYRKHRVRVNPYRPTRSVISRQERLKTVFTKSSEWRHEREYRRVFLLSDLIFVPIGKKGRKTYFLDIGSGAIREIVFGCRVKSSLEKRIRKELDRRKRTFSHVRLFRCVKHPSKFALKVVPIT
jgi:hypothetical protein